MNHARSLPAMLVLGLVAALPLQAQAQDRRAAEDACRDRAAANGRSNPNLDDVRYDRSRGGATLTGTLRSGKDDRFRFTCTLDRDGRVRNLSLARQGGGDDDRRGDRNDDRNRDRGNSGRYRDLVGSDAGTLDQQLRTMGFEPARRRGYWILGSTGECVAVRMSGNRTSDVRSTDVSNCK